MRGNNIFSRGDNTVVIVCLPTEKHSTLFEQTDGVFEQTGRSIRTDRTEYSNRQDGVFGRDGVFEQAGRSTRSDQIRLDLNKRRFSQLGSASYLVDSFLLMDIVLLQYVVLGEM